MKKLKILFWLIVACFILSFFLLIILGKKISPILYGYTSVETKRFTSNIVSSVVNDTLSNSGIDDLFNTVKNDNDEIQMLNYDTKQVNKLLGTITQKIQSRLINLEEGDLSGLNISKNFVMKNGKSIKNGVLCEVPMGSLRGNTLFVNIGPNIPIRINFIGQVQSNLSTKISNYGINNLFVEINVHVQVEQRITVPTMTKSATIEIEAPLTIKIIQGVIPEYYLSGLEKNSSIFSLPVE